MHKYNGELIIAIIVLIISSILKIIILFCYNEEYINKLLNNTSDTTYKVITTSTETTTTTSETTTTSTTTTSTTTTTTTTTRKKTTTTTTKPYIYTASLKFPTYNQNPKYPTGCETVALYILLNYYKVSVSIDTLINELDKAPISIINEDTGEICVSDPSKVFLGDPTTSKNSRGVYTAPIQKLANKYKEGAIAKVGLDFSEVEALVNSGRPVVAWTTINLGNSNVVLLGNSCETGEQLYWHTHEHAMVVIATDDKYVVVSDPYTGTIRYFNKSTFISRYNLMGKRVVYY